MPASEAWQLALGLSIPLLLIPHAGNIRIGQLLFGLDFDYPRLMHSFWDSPGTGITKQYVLLLVLWIHGCIGLRAWLASKTWYPRVASALASLALLVPVLALIGVTNAGLTIQDALQHNPALAGKLSVAPPGTAAAADLANDERIVRLMTWSYLGLVVATFSMRLARDWHARRFRAVHITYPDHRVVTVPVGFTLLEASRWAGIPHASACGGK
jgi:adenylate cyclase